MARSPSVAKPGDTTPRKVRSKPMRPTWIANRVAMKPRIQPRSIDARADSSSASRRARARTSGSSGSSRSATAVSPESPAVNTGERKMFKAVPKILAAPAAATVHATIACPRRTSSATQTRRLPRPARDPGQGGPACVLAEERAGKVADAVQAEPAGEEEDDRRGGEVGGVDEQDAHGQRDRAPDPRRPPPGLGRAAEAVRQLQHGGEDQQQPDPPLDLDPRNGVSSASAPRPRATTPSPLRHPAVSRGVGPGPPGLSSSSLRGCIGAVIVSPVFRRRFCDAPSRFVEFKLNA